MEGRKAQSNQLSVVKKDGFIVCKFHIIDFVLLLDSLARFFVSGRGGNLSLSIRSRAGPGRVLSGK